MNEEKPTTEAVNEAEFVLVHTTACDHDWQRAGVDPGSGMDTYVCTKCWSGRSG